MNEKDYSSLNVPTNGGQYGPSVNSEPKNNPKIDYNNDWVGRPVIFMMEGNNHPNKGIPVHDESEHEKDSSKSNEQDYKAKQQTNSKYSDYSKKS